MKWVHRGSWIDGHFEWQWQHSLVAAQFSELHSHLTYINIRLLHCFSKAGPWQFSFCFSWVVLVRGAPVSMHCKDLLTIRTMYLLLTSLDKLCAILTISKFQFMIKHVSQQESDTVESPSAILKDVLPLVEYWQQHHGDCLCSTQFASKATPWGQTMGGVYCE